MSIPSKLQTVATRKLLEHGRFTLVEDTVRLPNGGDATWIRFPERKDFVNVIAVSEQGKLLLMRQYNHPPREWLVEFPGGKIDAGETPASAAQRELLEETGYMAKCIESLGSFYANPRRATNHCHVFIATELTQADVNREPHELIEMAWVTPAEIVAMLRGESAETTSPVSNFLASWALYITSRAFPE